MNILKYNRHQMPSTFEKNLVIAEVGVLRGGFANLMFRGMQPKKMYLIDAWTSFDPGYEDGNITADDSVHEDNYNHVKNLFAKHSNVHLIRKFSIPAADDIADAELDMVYIDADHSYEGCLADIKAYYPKVKVGGFICGHDWLDDVNRRPGFGVKDAVLEFCETHDCELIGVTDEEYRSYKILKKG